MRDILRDERFPLQADRDRQQIYLEKKWAEQSCYQHLDDLHALWNKFQATGRMPAIAADNSLRRDWLNPDARGSYCLQVDNQSTIRTLLLPCCLYHTRAPSLVEVTANSPRLLREGVEVYAYYFRRELHYDFVQFSADETDKSWRCDNNGKWGWQQNRFVAWLFLPPHDLYVDGIGNSKTVGACCFRWREWIDAPHSWALQWIWLHPYFRRRGILSDAWSTFTEQFGKFHVEKPLSNAMYHFLLKVEAAR